MYIPSLATHSSIHAKRIQGRKELQRFRAHNGRAYDDAVDSVISQNKDFIVKAYDRINSLEDLRKNKPEEYEELQERASMVDVDLDDQIIDDYIDISDNGEQLLALVEMKVIYAYKSLEVNLKSLLTFSYKLSKSNTKQFYQWTSLSSFLKEKGIEISLLDGYKEVDELRKVNNALKHSDSISEDIKKIDEFIGLESLTYQALEAFYNRVAHNCNTFINSLNLAIEKDLYEFDEAKLQMIAKALILRMEKDDAIKLINELQSAYS